MDINNYQWALKRAKKIIDKNLKSGYKIFYKKLLPYVTPIAAQSAITLHLGLNNEVINDIYNTIPSVKMKELHLCVFPFITETLILLFYHKDDRVYYNLQKNFDKLSENDKLSYINYWIFKYTENYFLHKSIESEIKNNDVLKKLCQEEYDLPNLGCINLFEPYLGYDCVRREDIPNFLLSQYKVRGDTP